MNTLLFILPSEVAALLCKGEIAKLYPGAARYWVTTLGRVISFNHGKAHVHRCSRNTRGYPQVAIQVVDQTGAKRWIKPTVNRAVATTFLPVPEELKGNYYDACHNNSNKLDNRLENIRWDSRPENQWDNFLNGHRAGKTPDSGLTPVAVWTARCQALYEPVEDVVREYAQAYGVEKETVRAALSKKGTWKRVPFPDEHPSLHVFMRALRLSEERAAELLALMRPRRAA